MAGSPPKFQVALQGGGAKLYALLAATDVLQDLASEKKIEITRVAGVSAGAIAALCLVAGIKTSIIARAIRETNFLNKVQSHKPKLTLRGRLLDAILQNFAWSNGVIYQLAAHLLLSHETAVVPIDEIEDLLKHVLQEYVLQKKQPLPSPLRFKDINPRIELSILASNLDTGLPESYTSEADILLSLRNSISIPGLTRPVARYKEQFLADGGFYSNLPIDELDSNVDKYGAKLAVVFPQKEQNALRKRSRWPATFSLALGQAIIETLMDSSINRTRKQSQQQSVRQFLDAPNNAIIFIKDITTVEVPVELRSTEFASLWKLLENPSHKKVKKSRDTFKKHLMTAMDNILPHEVQRAINRSTEFKQTSEIANISPMPTGKISYDIVMVPYTEIPEVWTMQEELKKQCSAAFPSQHFSNRSAHTILGTRFDAILHPKGALADEKIYTFPFFLPQTRVSIWGIIPYAKLTKIGVMVSRNSAAFDNIQNVARNSEQDDDRSPVDTRWVNSVIHSIPKGGHIYSVRGYMIDEMIPLWVRAVASQEEQDKFLNCSENFKHEIEIVETMGGKGRWKMRASLTEGEKLELAQGNSVAFIDLCDARAYQEAMGSDSDLIEVFPIRHGLSIPVGIGFSLPMAQHLLDNAGQGKPRWRALRESAQEGLAEIRLPLEKVGISLT